jgi:predicted SAM-dependent methyltransferase
MKEMMQELSPAAAPPDFFEARIQPFTKRFLTTGRRRQVYVWDLLRLGTLVVWPYYRLRASVGRYDGAKVNAGAGASRLPGWLNIDANPLRSPHIWADLRNRWPFREASIASIVSSHFLEHLFDNELERVLREMYRVLRPGGNLRISVPSLEKAISDYLDESDIAGPATRGHRFNLTCHWYGAHHQVFDMGRLRDLLAQAGFASFSVPQFPHSSFCSAAEVIEIDRHPDESLFLECKKRLLEPA